MAKCSNGLCFHGAFNKKSDAERKRAKVGGDAFILKKWVGKRNQRFAFVVATRDRDVEFNPFNL